MGSCQGGLPLTVIPGREVTSDTILLARLASDVPFRICFDLGTGTGGILRNMTSLSGFSLGIDFSMNALVHFSHQAGQPVLCSVEQISRTFREGCADLVVANPPYFSTVKSRPSPDENRRTARTGDPLTVHRFIFSSAWLLRHGGTLVISSNSKSEKETELGLAAAGFRNCETHRENGVAAIRAEWFSRI